MAITKTELINVANNNEILVTKNAAPFGTFSYQVPDGDDINLAVRVYRDGVEAETTAVVDLNISAAPTGMDPDYQAVLDASSAAGNTLPSAAEQTAGNQYMIDLKASGLYSRAKVLFVPEFGGDAGHKSICWKRKIQMIAVAGAFDATGYAGSAGCAIKTGFIPSSEPSLQNNAGFAVVNLLEVSPSQHLMGVRDATVSKYVAVYNGTSGFMNIRFNDGPAVAETVVKSGDFLNSLVSYNKVGAVDYEIIKGSTADSNRVSESLTGTSTTPSQPANELYFMAGHRPDDGLGTIDKSNVGGKVKFMYYGESIEDIHDAVNAVVKVGA